MANNTIIWSATLNRLQEAQMDTVCRAWLQSANLVSTPNFGADDLDADDLDLVGQEEPLYFTLHVPSPLARDVINTRWRRAIEDILTDLTGQPVTILVSDFFYEEGASSYGQSGIPDTTGGRSVPAGYYSREGNLYAPTSRYSQGSDYASYDFQNRSIMSQELAEAGGAARGGSGGRQAFDQAPLYYTQTDEWNNEQRATILMQNRLNSRYTFDAFIVGNSNRLAHAASLAVAEAPGESYNPLFLYGGVGLGKTHLLHAIGHQGIQAGLAVLYVSSEQFTNEIVNAIRFRTTEEFRAKYRSVDILLVDDIQFIAGKESTEEEFFHTFNSLYEMSKQIVICSDRPPKAIISLEERLRSRFEWGLIADIQPPDLETRMAILRVKADALHYPIPDDIITYIAGRVQTNIRELEGYLNRLMAFQHLHQTELTLEVARAAMSSLGNDMRDSRIDIKQIAQVVAEYYHISMEDMCGKQRDKHIVMPRQVAMYLMRQETQASLLEIGAIFGGRDHSTVLHACEKIDRAINVDPALRREIVAIREQLQRE